MSGINLSPRALASRRGASGTAGRLLAGSPSAESASMAAPSGVPFTGRPRAADLAGPIEPTDLRKLAEAYAMATRRDHPLHHALMDRLHPDHARAVADYERLHEQAFAPRTAVRGKPAEAHPQTGAASLITPAEKPPATGLKRPSAGPAMLTPLPAQKPPAQPVAPIPPQKPAGSVKPEGAAEPPSSLEAMPRPEVKQRPERQWLSERVMQRGTVEEIIAFDRRAGAEDQARQAPPPFRDGLPPRTFAVSASGYEAMRDAIEAMPSLSPTERYVFMRILTYEGTGYDSSGRVPSRGGILQSTWNDIKEQISKWRTAEGRNTPVPESVKDLAVEDIFDAMRAYAQQEFGNDGAAEFAKIDNRELAFQLFDLEYQYGSESRNTIWNKAAARVVARMEREGLSLVERVRLLENIHSLNSKQRMQAIGYMEERDVAQEFLGYLQQEKTAWWMDPSHPDRRRGYTGSTRARIWGMTQQP